MCDLAEASITEFTKRIVISVEDTSAELRPSAVATPVPMVHPHKRRVDRDSRYAGNLWHGIAKS